MMRAPMHSQRGAVLVVGLIVLMLITVMVAAAFKFSTYNLKAVGNMQAHHEAIAAANRAIEQMIESRTFTEVLPGETLLIDIDQSGSNDYSVDIATPVCLKATRSATPGEDSSEVYVQENGELTNPSTTGQIVLFSTIWEVDATATSTSSGSRVRVRQGISKSLTQTQCNAACPPPGGTVCG